MTNQEANVTLKVNSKEAQQKLEQLEAKATQLRTKFADAFRRGDTRAITDINKQLQKVNKEMDNMRTNAANIRAAMVRLDKATPRELQRTIKLINNELNSGRVQRGTKEWEQYVAQLKKAQMELKKVKAQMSIDDRRSVFGKIKDSINDWGATAAAAMGAFAGVVMSGKAAVKAYADMEGEMANVRKYTGMTAQEVEQLNEAFKSMDTRTSREELNQLAQEAGRLGKTSVEDVLGFVKAADQINVALNDLGEGATLILSKLTGIFGDEQRYGTEQSLLKVGSVINELSQNCSASAPYLAEFSSRLGGIAAQSNMTISQVMAFAAVLDTQNLAVEASATSVGQLITKIYQEPAKIAKAAGLDVKQFSALVKSDMNGALIQLFEHLKEFGGMDSLAKIFDAMGTDGARAIPVLAALTGHVEELKQQQINAATAFEEGLSVTREFNVQNNTVQAQLDKAKKGFTEMAVSLGEKLLPVMQYCISGSSLLMKVIKTIVDFIIKYKGVVIVITSAIASYYATVTLAKVATAAWNAVILLGKNIMSTFRTIVGLCEVAVIRFTKGSQAAKNAMHALNNTMKASPWGMVIAAVTAIAVAIYKLVTKVDEYKKALDNAMKTAAGFDEQCVKEQQELDKLFGKLEGTRKGTKEYEDAKSSIIKQYGKYLQGLINERGEITNLEEAYNRLTFAVRQNAKVRGISAARDSITTDYTKTIQDDLEALRQSLINFGADAKTAQRIVAATSQQVATGVAIPQDIQSLLYQYQRQFDLSHLTDRENTPVAIFNRITGRMEDFANRMSNLDDMEEAVRPAKNASDVTLEAAMTMIQRFLDTTEDSQYISVIQPDGTMTSQLMTRDQAAELLKLYQWEKSERTSPTTDNPENKPQGTMDVPTDEDKALKAAKDALKKDLEERQGLYTQAQAENLALYLTGERNYQDYCNKRAQLEQEYTDDVIAIHEKHKKIDVDGYSQALLSKQQLLQKQLEQQRRLSLQQLEQQKKDAQQAATLDFYDPNGGLYQNQEALNKRLLDADYEYLQGKLRLYKEGSDEYIATQREINDLLYKEQLEQQKRLQKAIEDYQKLNGNTGLAVRYQAELDALDLLHDKKLISEEEYLQAVERLRAKYRDIDMGATMQQYNKMFGNLINILGDKGTNISGQITDWLNGLSEEERKAISDGFEMGFNNVIGCVMLNGFTAISSAIDAFNEKDDKTWKDKIAMIGQLAVSAANIIGGVMQTFSNYWATTRDIEVAKAEKRYDAEIKAAGNNSKKVQKLEKEKEEQISKIKNKYNNRAMKMEVAQAIAQTAANALGAYGAMVKIPVVGPALAAAAAAAAIAAGAIQIATIKKQHEAEAAGYYEGGYTSKDSNNRRAVGVVHANEFVANHKAVANPAIAPVLNLIDQAQRNNTVGSLTTADVQRAIGNSFGVGAGGGTSAPQNDQIAASLALISAGYSQTGAIMTKLTDKIEAGIEAFVVMDGERGFDKTYNRYKRLMEAPKR